MKINGKALKRRLYGMSRLRDRMARTRHFRGHGVHSPFVYAVVRQVFMRSRLLSGEHALHDALAACGVPERRAVQLQNLFVHCKCSTWAVDDPASAADIVVATAAVPCVQLEAYAANARRHGTTLAVMSPGLNRDRDRACRALVDAHACTAVDNRGYLLLFNNHLPKQYFKL